MFDPMRVDQQVRLGDLEEWTLRNMDDDEWRWWHDGCSRGGEVIGSNEL